jgi:hypothetical protein
MIAGPAADDGQGVADVAAADPFCLSRDQRPSISTGPEQLRGHSAFDDPEGQRYAMAFR